MITKSEENANDTITESMTKLFGDMEELDEELVPCIRESSAGFMVLQHPLMTEIYIEQFNGRYNTMLEHKKTALEYAENHKRWDSYVFIHSRPFRLQALLSLHDRGVLKNRQQAADIVVDAWSDAEWPGSNARIWLKLFRQYVRDTVYDWKAGAKLPTDGRIYRGVSRSEELGLPGISWTLDREKAEWFAKRNRQFFGGDARVYSVCIPRQAAIAYIDNRSEEEIIVDSQLIDTSKLECRVVA